MKALKTLKEEFKEWGVNEESERRLSIDFKNCECCIEETIVKEIYKNYKDLLNRKVKDVTLLNTGTMLFQLNQNK